MITTGTPSTNSPLFSLVVIAYDMARELPRTLHSLSRSYQLDAKTIDYEVIVIDNGSPRPLSEKSIKAHGDNFRLIRIDKASHSPAAAVNLGIREARGQYLGIIVDGARLVTPGILYWAQRAFKLNQRSVVSVVGFHLGPDLQRISSQSGYSQQVEDELLERVNWPLSPYRLYEIASLAASSIAGWCGPQGESNCILLPAQLCREIGGFDERFRSSGGGLVNLDFYKRSCEAGNVKLFCLNGEGSFHQIHGGATTGGQGDELQKLQAMQQEYRDIRGSDYRVPQNPQILIGQNQPAANALLIRGAGHMTKAYQLEELRKQHIAAVGLDSDC
jgi:hypothetical protein